MKRVSVITGFLGSGKTTLLNRLLRHPQMSATAVLINELGKVGVDNLIVDRLDDDVVLLESGCVCCSVRDDLAASLHSLSRRAEAGLLPPFDQVVLETTGIADPAAILQLLMSDAAVCERFRIGSLVTVVDACFAAANLDSIPEAVRQVAFADRLVISKTDLVDAATVATLCNRLSKLNPDATQLSATDAEPTTLFTPQTVRAHRKPDAAAGHGHRFGTFQLGWPEAVEWSSVEAWMEGLLTARGEDIWRIKGLLNVRGDPRPLVFQSVQHSVYVPASLPCWPVGQVRTELTFIAQHFSRAAAIRSLQPFIAATIDD